MKHTVRAYMGTIIAFLYLPIFVLITFSFNASKNRSVWVGFTFDWYRQLFSNEVILSTLGNTLLIAVVSSVLATIVGTAAAIGINSMKRLARTTIMNLTYLPILNPEIVTGVSLMLLFVAMRMQFGYVTLILAHISFNIPCVILSVMPKLRQMDVYIFEAALDLGCSPRTAFFKVVLPEIMPGVLSGFLMAFTYSLDDFIISYFTSGPASQTLPITIFAMTRRKVSPEINALSAIIFVVALLVLILYNLYDIRREKLNRYTAKERSSFR